MFCGPKVRATEGPSCAVRMRLPRPAHFFAAPEGAPPKVPVAHFDCVFPSQCNGSWSHRELHRRSQWCRSYASPLPSTAFCGPVGSSTEGPRGAVRMRLPRG
eukprot:6121791-Pyramimonas_sp.AAC.1